jgi:hypothetical protein
MKSYEVTLSPEAEVTYNLLKKSAETSKIERSIFNSINKKAEIIRSDPQYGDQIAKNRIPNEYIVRYGITNLFRIELSSFWRMIYTLAFDDTNFQTTIVILDILDHKEYDKKFGYRRS